MYIIFGNEEIETIREKYTVLELDTIRVGDTEPRTAYCVLQSVPFDDIPNLEHLKTLHQNLINNYGQQEWKLCRLAIEELTSRWGGELDSFYAELASRIDDLETQDLGPDWIPIIQK
jgi:hypothetical protein